MDASLMARMKELEDENSRLKKMYAEERLKAKMWADHTLTLSEQRLCFTVLAN